MFRNRYLTLDSEFSGTMVISSLNGDFIRGYIVKNGIRVKRLGAPVQKTDSAQITRKNICYEDVCDYYVDCYGIYDDDDYEDPEFPDMLPGGGVQCDDILDCYQILGFCDDDGDDGGDPGYDPCYDDPDPDLCDCFGWGCGNSNPPDCNGVVGGSAYTDACGNCVGGTTGNQPCVPDCNGTNGGNAYTDACGNCVGGNTGLTPCDPNSPCAKLSNKDSDFRNKLDDLKTKTSSMTLETAYLRASNGNYSSFVGTKRGEVDWNVLNPITELSHNHNTGLLPIYSIQDLKGLYDLYGNGKMVNRTDFNYVLVTPNATYDIKITDENLFLTNFVYTK